MMRISERRNVIIMLAASFALFAPSDDFSVNIDRGDTASLAGAAPLHPSRA